MIRNRLPFTLNRAPFSKPLLRFEPSVQMFATFVVNFLKYLFRNLLYLFRLKRPAIEPKRDSMYLITVNYNIKQLNGHLKIGFNRDSKIADAKQIIVNELNKLLLAKFADRTDSLKSNQIAIIFAGREIETNFVVLF